jgi:hypothetical protein
MRRELGIEILRPRVLDLIAQSSFAPVRMICAPHGGGKTTVLRQFALQNRHIKIVSLPRHASRLQVIACLGQRANATLTLVDQFDQLSPAGSEALFEIIEANWPFGNSYLLAGASRTQMHVQSMMARGIAAVIDSSVLSFSSSEIAELANAYGVACDEMDVEQLKYDTEGWPLAVSWIVRDAARDGHGLRGAFERWRERNGHMLIELVAASHNDTASTETFVTAIRSPDDPASQRALERLEANGYPIVRMCPSFRPYRLLTQIADAQQDPTPAEHLDGRLVITLFGRFSCRIAHRSVAFDRRRDQNVLTYIALAADATVTRAELLITFWPNASAAVASQGLRSTLWRLRRALAEAAGCDAGRYISVGNSIALDLDWVSIDARLFREYAERAATAIAKGDRLAARDHYRQAERLHVGTLLASEAAEPQLAAQVIACADLLETVRAQVQR